MGRVQTEEQADPRRAFTLRQGREAGLSDAAMRRAVFERPFHGVRARPGPADRGLIDRCAELQVALAPQVAFSHATAARLWNMPLPRWIRDELHVTSPGAAVRRAGVVGWKRAGDAPERALLRGVAVTTPAETWVALATMTDARGGRMPREWLVAVGDFLVSGRRTRFGREKPLATAADLVGALARHGSRRGAAVLDWAFERLRSPVDSPPESFLRLAIVEARMPEPAVQPAIMTAVGVRHPDLGFLDQGVLLEYLGDVHRTDAETWRRDLQRVQLFEDAGYRVLMVGAADLTATGLPALCHRIRRALRA